MNTMTDVELTNLQKAVLDILRDETADYDDPADFYRDVIEYGCVSGCVTALNWYTDTNHFFEEHQEALAREIRMWKLMGEDVTKLDTWDDYDPFCNEVYNRNQVVWFVFEKITRYFYEVGIY